VIPRAYLDDARSGPGLDRLAAEVARILDLFGAAGAIRVEPPALLPAEVLLDLYGEDIRARAFLIDGPDGEVMLRPDFTVPVVQMHMAGGAEPARYCYAGPVWRQRAEARAREYLQAGIEIFDGRDAAAADAAVFDAVTRAAGKAPPAAAAGGASLAAATGSASLPVATGGPSLAAATGGASLAVATGDMGLVLAAIAGLGTTPARKAALRRHVWRPWRFQRLLDRFSAPAVARHLRVGDIAAAGQVIGLRTPDEVAARIGRLSEEARTPPLHPRETGLIAALLALRGTCAGVLPDLRRLALPMPGLGAAVDRFAARLDALAALGHDPAALPFEGSYGRTSLEYYDGFVFGLYAPGRPDLPVIASGGRYDALTAALGHGRAIPAVGGILRPEALLALSA
jgi:ATP phosphoribosyltransferase regulatory subunit